MFDWQIVLLTDAILNEELRKVTANVDALSNIVLPSSNLTFYIHSR